MVESRIPVDLTNPGQVISCLGFMEACDALGLGPVTGGFDWSDESDIRFRLQTQSGENPTEAVLSFLAEAELSVLVPARSKRDDDMSQKSVRAESAPPFTFPALPKEDANIAPVVLSKGDYRIEVCHWADASRREPFKTFAGQQVASEIIRKMLRSDDTRKASKRAANAFDALYTEDPDRWVAEPFSRTVALETAFGFDARGGWDAIRLGSSADTQNLPAGISPVVEILCSLGLSHARPSLSNRTADGSYGFAYSAWSDQLHLALARPALGMIERSSGSGLKLRRFRSHQGKDKYYKKFFFATEIMPS